MSVSGYFQEIKSGARMPKSDRNTADELGTHRDGRALNGELSLLEALQKNALAVKQWPTGPHGEPDPVLRHHMRIDKP